MGRRPLIGAIALYFVGLTLIAIGVALELGDGWGIAVFGAGLAGVGIDAVR